MFSVLCKFLSYGKKFSNEGCSPILIGSFGFPEHISCENFFPRLKKSSSTWETIMRSYLPCSGRGWGFSWSLVIQSGFTNMLQIKNFFPKLKTSDSTQKPYVGSFLLQKGQGWYYRLHPDLDCGSFRFPEYIPCENSKLKNSQIKLYIIMEAYLPHS